MDSAESQEIAKLYAAQTALREAGEDKSSKVGQYEILLNGTKKSTKCQILAAEMLPELFKYFPEKKQDTMIALCDLVELDDIVVSRAGTWKIAQNNIIELLAK